jgi:cytochrome b6-f complex iron-sulfur subunit
MEARVHRPPVDASQVTIARTRLAVERRSFLRGTFLGGIGLAMLGGVSGLVDFLWPRNVRGFGGPVAAGTLDEIPAPGAPPIEFREGQFWLVNLDPDDTAGNGSGGGSGLLALWKKCPHLGCAVPWKDRGVSPPTFVEEEWFQCPCHGSTYTRAGVRVHGPAPRSMDTMAISIDGDGRITVDTGAITTGGLDNPQRAVPARPGAASV